MLDSYALRTGETAWATPMTEEGLREVRAALKRSATRQTAVACYRNEGRSAMKLLWVVGSRAAFGPDGHFPLGSTTVKSAKPAPDWLRVVSLLSQAGGWCHDLGKASRLFQAKLRATGPVQDAVRHEWVSLQLLQALRQGKSWDAAWEALGKENRVRANPLENGIAGAWDALGYLVATHHRLLGPAHGPSRPDESLHVHDTGQLREKLQPEAALSERPFANASRLIARAEKLAPGQGQAYWRAAAILARAGLILADHVVSARKYAQEAALYANTHQGSLNQPLEWHLAEVAHYAADAAFRLANLRLPGLSEEAVEAVCRPAGEAFAWQNRVADALEAFRERSPLPVLAFNMAATGSGKTRMNARAACLLAQGPVRFAASLNLRTLTLQTGYAFREQLHIGADEMACIIGCKITQTLHEQAREAEADADGNPAEPAFETSAAEFEIPAWLEAFAQGKPAFRAVLGAPVLVSTVDFLIAAGMPQRQGHHVAALLRLAAGDLVLDEVDGYDPKPLAAILRLVQMAALFGRNVICSSATLAQPVALALHRAYHSGAGLRAALAGTAPAFACALFDDANAPQIVASAEQADFQAAYGRHLDRMRAGFGRRRERLAYLQTVAERSPEAWLAAVLAGVDRLHQAHAWRHAASGKCLSFGLVRVANIRHAVATARFLAEQRPQARVACYHADDWLMARFLKERCLDRLLRRAPGDARLQQDAELRDWLAAAAGEDVPFIVVATPVEEIGRDHDFDWAIIEPSSTRSIVQTAGRVNRHRHVPVGEANIALLQFNQRWARGKNTVFCRPGFEDGEQAYPCHDLARLLDWAGGDVLAIDAGLMFGGHDFAHYDNQAIQAMLDRPLERLFALDSAAPWWIGQAIYQDYALRDHEPRQDWILDEEGKFHLLDWSGGKPRPLERDAQVARIRRIGNDWLAWPPEVLLEACRQHGIPLEQGLRVALRDGPVRWDASFGFV